MRYISKQREGKGGRGRKLEGGEAGGVMKGREEETRELASISWREGEGEIWGRKEI